MTTMTTKISTTIYNAAPTKVAAEAARGAAKETIIPSFWRIEDLKKRWPRFAAIPDAELRKYFPAGVPKKVIEDLEKYGYPPELFPNIPKPSPTPKQPAAENKVGSGSGSGGPKAGLEPPCPNGTPVPTVAESSVPRFSSISEAPSFTASSILNPEIGAKPTPLPPVQSGVVAAPGTDGNGGQYGERPKKMVTVTVYPSTVFTGPGASVPTVPPQPVRSSPAAARPSRVAEDRKSVV